MLFVFWVVFCFFCTFFHVHLEKRVPLVFQQLTAEHCFDNCELFPVKTLFASPGFGALENSNFIGGDIAVRPQPIAKATANVNQNGQNS